MDEPPLAIYMRQWHAPDAKLKNVPGFGGSSGVAPRDATNTTLYLQDAHLLSTEVSKPASHQLRYIPSVGWKLDSGGANCSPINVRWMFQPDLRYRAAERRLDLARTSACITAG